MPVFLTSQRSARTRARSRVWQQRVPDAAGEFIFRHLLGLMVFRPATHGLTPWVFFFDHFAAIHGDDCYPSNPGAPIDLRRDFAFCPRVTIGRASYLLTEVPARRSIHPFY